MTHAPISWLMLEQYALDELSGEARARVEAALDQSPALRERLAEIHAQRACALRPLPPLERRRSWVPLRVRWPVLATAALAAAVTFGLIGRRSASTLPGLKGGADVQLSLLRKSADTISADATEFAEGDTFQVVVTCGLVGEHPWQLAVFQGAQVAFPLDEAKPLVCGNRVVLPGAFRVSGSEVVLVCLSLGGEVVDRAELLRRGLPGLKASASCVHLRPR